MSPEPSYSYEDVADRIEQVFGERPSLSTLRAAASDERRRTSPRPWPRITAGMPAPRKPRSNPARFSQIEVEAWLADHPRHAWEAVRLRLVESIGPENVNPAAIAAAHSEGLSWRQIAAVITEKTGTPHTAGSVYNAYAVTQRK